MIHEKIRNMFFIFIFFDFFRSWSDYLWAVLDPMLWLWLSYCFDFTEYELHILKNRKLFFSMIHETFTKTMRKRFSIMLYESFTATTRLAVYCKASVWIISFLRKKYKNICENQFSQIFNNALRVFLCESRLKVYRKASNMISGNKYCDTMPGVLQI